MIAKGKSITHLAPAIDYALRKEESYVLDKNVVGEKGAAIAKEFKHFQQFSPRCARNSFSFVLSPTIEDGKKLTEERLKEINQAFLKALKLKDHQYIAVVHHDKAHKHIHLFVNRVSYQGKAYKDQFISNKASRAAEQIPLERGLQTARSVQEERYQERRNSKDITTIRGMARKTLRQRGVNTVSKFIEAFNEKGEASSLRCEAYYNKQDQFQGLRFYVGDAKYKASEVDRALGKQQLQETLRKKDLPDKQYPHKAYSIGRLMEEEEEYQEELLKKKKKKKRAASITYEMSM